MIRRPPRSPLFPSPPLSRSHKSAATATAEPELEPDGVRFSAWGFSVWPPRALQPLEECVERKLAHRSEEHTSELQSPCNLVCRLLLEKKKTDQIRSRAHP